MRRRSLPLGFGVAGVAVALVAAATALATPTRSRSLQWTPRQPPKADFSAHVDNVWFPLRPGTRYVYTGVKDGQPSRDVVVVTHRTVKIGRVPCVVVLDRLYLRGRLRERTTDWYAQDTQGNVWYFGEDTAELDRQGQVTSTAGTWKAFVHGAQPGIYMPADPHVGQVGRQEFYRGQAEDHFKVIALFGTVATGAKNTLVTEETTPLEPGTVDHKLYVRGIGNVLEQTEKGGDERNELVSVSR